MIDGGERDGGAGPSCVLAVVTKRASGCRRREDESCVAFCIVESATEERSSQLVRQLGETGSCGVGLWCGLERKGGEMKVNSMDWSASGG